MFKAAGQREASFRQNRSLYVVSSYRIRLAGTTWLIQLGSEKDYMVMSLQLGVGRRTYSFAGSQKGKKWGVVQL